MTTTTAKASGIDAVFFSVTDVPRATAFYKELLDIKETSFEGDWGAEWVLSDGTAFGIGKVPSGHRPSGCVLFAVADVQALSSRVWELGGTLDGELRDLPPCRQQWCLDPDGNAFVLHEKKN